MCTTTRILGTMRTLVLLLHAVVLAICISHSDGARVCAPHRVGMRSPVLMSAKKAFKPMVVDVEAEGKLLVAVKEPKRDTAQIGALLDSLGNRDGGVRPESLVGGWALRWVPNVQALDIIGTGLHAMRGTTFEDLFISFGTEKTKKVEANEVLRVFGPFPSVRNVLSGTYSYDAAKNGRLRIVFSEMVDGLGSRIVAKDGSSERVIDLNVRYAGPQVLIAAKGEDSLIFEKVQSVREELIRLRVLKADADKDKK